MLFYFLIHVNIIEMVHWEIFNKIWVTPLRIQMFIKEMKYKRSMVMYDFSYFLLVDMEQLNIIYSIEYFKCYNSDYALECSKIGF